MEQQTMQVVWRYMDIKSLFSLFRINKNFLEFSRQPHMWRFLIERDYKIQSKSKHSRRQYIKLLLQKVSTLSSNYGQYLFSLIQPSNQAEYNKSLTTSAIDHKNMALSLVGIDDEPTFNFFGNQVGIKLKTLLDEYSQILTKCRSNYGSIDALLFIIHNIEGATRAKVPITINCRIIDNR